MPDSFDQKPSLEKSIEPWHLDKRVPITLIIAIVIQSVTFVWWAAKLDSKVQEYDHRITVIESWQDGIQTILGQVNERLARIEERGTAMVETLKEINQNLRRGR